MEQRGERKWEAENESGMTQQGINARNAGVATHDLLAGSLLKCRSERFLSVLQPRDR